MRLIPVFLLPLLLWGCAGIPKGVEPVKDFELKRYLGTWYEIARYDHSFERGLEQVTAHYSMRRDGGVRVVNRGYDPEKGVWKEATGKAFFVSKPDIGRMKVSFFGPFYGGYNIIDLDSEDYSFALVCGPNRSYLWILSRSPWMEQSTLSRLKNSARRAGFDTDKLIHVKQEEY